MKYILLPFTAVYRVICAIFSAPQKLFGKAEDKVIDAQEQNRIKKEQQEIQQLNATNTNVAQTGAQLYKMSQLLKREG